MVNWVIGWWLEVAGPNYQPTTNHQLTLHSMVKFFTQHEEKQIIETIQEAETVTSGEIRIHLRHKCQGDPVTEARKIFARLGMHQVPM